MKGFMLLSVFLILMDGYSQSPVSVHVSGGFVVPTGKNIQSAYTVGFEVGGGLTIRSNNMFVGVDGTLEYYINNPPSASSLSDRLTLFGPQLSLGYSFGQIEPYVSVGYAWGVNSISDNAFFGNSLDLMNLHGLSIGPGVGFRFTDEIAVSLCYRFYSPDFTLTQEAQRAINSTGATPTQLYGPVINFPSGTLAMDRLSVQLNCKL